MQRNMVPEETGTAGAVSQVQDTVLEQAAKTSQEMIQSLTTCRTQAGKDEWQPGFGTEPIRTRKGGGEMIDGPRGA